MQVHVLVCCWPAAAAIMLPWLRTLASRWRQALAALAVLPTGSCTSSARVLECCWRRLPACMQAGCTARPEVWPPPPHPCQVYGCEACQQDPVVHVRLVGCARMEIDLRRVHVAHACVASRTQCSLGMRTRAHTTTLRGVLQHTCTHMYACMHVRAQSCRHAGMRSRAQSGKQATASLSAHTHARVHATPCSWRWRR